MHQTRISIEDIGKMQAAALAAARDYPYRPMLLELALVGLSRWSIASLTMSSFKENCKGVVDGKECNIEFAVVWHERNNVERVTQLSRHQWTVAMHYLQWRYRHAKVQPPSACLLVARGRAQQQSWYQAIVPERVRSEIRTIGRDALVGDGVEIPQLHEAMANWMRLNGVPDRIILEYYPREDGSRRVGKKFTDE